MKKGKLILVKGLPYSGKTTWVREQCGKKRDWVRLSWTEIRGMMTSKEYDRSLTLMAVDTALKLMCRALNEGKTVVLDELNLYSPLFALFLSVAQKVGARVEWHLVKCDVDECKRRCLRNGGSTADVMRIESFAQKYEFWLME